MARIQGPPGQNLSVRYSNSSRGSNGGAGQTTGNSLLLIGLYLTLHHVFRLVGPPLSATEV